MMKVLAVNGSPRRKGNTNAMIDAAAKEMKARGIRVELLSMSDLEIRPCDGCEKCYKRLWYCPIKDDAVAVLKRMVSSDGVLIGTPVYFGGVTAQLKALFDRSIMPYQRMELRDKVAGALSVGGGLHGGQELAVWQIATFCITHDMVFVNAPGGLYGAMATGNDIGDVEADKEGMKSASALGKRMAEVLLQRKA